MGAASRGGINLVLFCADMSEAVAPPEVPHFLLLSPLGLVRMDLLGVYCELAGAAFLTVDHSPVIAVMISSKCFVYVLVRVTLVVAAFTSVSMSFTSSSDVEGLFTFSLYFQERTGTGGFSLGSSSSSLMMCFFLDLEDVVLRGSSSSVLGSAFFSFEELSIIDLTSSSSG